MGSSASVNQGASEAGRSPIPHGPRGGMTPSTGLIRSNASSVQTDGRAGNETWGGQSFRSSTPVLNRAKSRHALAKKLVKGRVMFLGLDGAGKTTLVQQLLNLASVDEVLSDGRTKDQPVSARPTSPLNMLQSSSSMGDLLAQDGTRIPRVFPNPTRTTGYSSYRLDGEKFVQLVDVPGRRAYRAAHWRLAFGGDPAVTLGGTGTTTSALPIVGVVFVVDATDVTRFPLVARELVALQKLKDGRLPNGTPTPLATWLQRAPFLLVLNKVDAAASGNQHTVNSPERRQASRTMRQELKAAFDHQLRMDQKKHPGDYTPHPSPTTGGTNSSASKKRAALAEANSNRKTLLMTSLVECCAFDHDCVCALNVLIRDEIRRLWSGAP